jgi:hypothetical protein
VSSAPPNQSGPLLLHDAEPPGGFVDGIWRGELNWRTQHGSAMVQWSMGVPTYVWNAIKSTAAESTTGRVNVRGRYPASDLFRVDANNSRAHGRILIMPDDVEFSVIEQLPAPEIEDEFMPLAELLRRMICSWPIWRPMKRRRHYTLLLRMRLLSTPLAGCSSLANGVRPILSRRFETLARIIWISPGVAGQNSRKATRIA